MKTIIYVCFSMVLFTVACHREKTVSFIPGTYVNHAKGVYSLADDTLVIRLLEGNNYEILRKTGFNRITEGKLGKREYEAEIWNAVYDGDAKVLNELRYGKVFSFYPDSEKLRLGNRTYNKLK